MQPITNLNRATSSASPGAAVSYAFKASLIGTAHSFEITDDGLRLNLAGRSRLWAYADITAVRLSYRPVSLQARRFRADISHRDGGRVTILSTSWQTAALMTPQDDSYRAFILELHARLQATASRAALCGGLSRPLYAIALAAVALFALAMTGLLARALATGQWAGAAFIIGFAALFGWQVGGFLRRNRPCIYTFAHIPERLLPG